MLDLLLKNKTIVITGGTKGLGRDLAFWCADAGANVSISGRNEKDGQSIVEEINKKLSGRAIYIKSNLCNINECENLITETVRYFGEIDGLVNYAGYVSAGSIIDTEESMFDKVFNINIKAAFFCTKFALISMIKSGKGSIVNIGSAHAYGGDEEMAAYAVSKGALLSLTRYVSRNFAKYNIRANWISMGWVATPGEMELRASQGKDLKWLKATAKKVIPMGRMQTTKDHIPTIINLLSEQSSQLTGSEIHITGGLTLK